MKQTLYFLAGGAITFLIMFSIGKSMEKNWNEHHKENLWVKASDFEKMGDTLVVIRSSDMEFTKMSAMKYMDMMWTVDMPTEEEMHGDMEMGMEMNDTMGMDQTDMKMKDDIQ